MKIYKFLWPFTAYCVQKCTNWQIFDSNIRRDHQKISYERRDYESVEEKSLSQAMSRKTMNKRIQALKG